MTPNEIESEVAQLRSHLEQTLARIREIERTEHTASAKVPRRKLLTVKEAAEIVCCSLKTVYEICGTPDLPAFRPHGRGTGERRMLRIWSDDLDRYIEKQMVRSDAE